MASEWEDEKDPVNLEDFAPTPAVEGAFSDAVNSMFGAGNSAVAYASDAANKASAQDAANAAAKATAPAAEPFVKAAAQAAAPVIAPAIAEASAPAVVDNIWGRVKAAVTANPIAVGLAGVGAALLVFGFRRK